MSRNTILIWGENKNSLTSAVVDRIRLFPEKEFFLFPIFFWNELKERVRMEKAFYFACYIVS